MDKRRRRYYYYNRAFAGTTQARSQREADSVIERNANVIVIVRRDDGSPKTVVFRCPDGCGETLRVNVSDIPGTPSWRLRVDRDGRVSLYPSVWRTTGCHAHFFLTLSTARGYKNERPPTKRLDILV